MKTRTKKREKSMKSRDFRNKQVTIPWIFSIGTSHDHQGDYSLTYGILKEEEDGGNESWRETKKY